MAHGSQCSGSDTAHSHQQIARRTDTSPMSCLQRHQRSGPNLQQTTAFFVSTSLLLPLRAKTHARVLQKPSAEHPADKPRQAYLRYPKPASNAIRPADTPMQATVPRYTHTTSQRRYVRLAPPSPRTTTTELDAVNRRITHRRLSVTALAPQ